MPLPPDSPFRNTKYTHDHTGITMVSANGKGISLITAIRLVKQPPSSGYVWKLPANFPMPLGLGLNPDKRFVKPGELLSKLASQLERFRKL